MLSTMPREGRDLETLIARIETALSPLGVEVTSPDFFTDRITGQQREVDISIRGKIGSADVLIICECRDRSGSQDVTWIEQLAQKRHDVGAAKAIAVSSSAFTGPALIKAKFLGIETRLLHELKPEEIAGWFQSGNMTLSTYHTDLIRVSLTIGPNSTDNKLADEAEAAFNHPEEVATKEFLICKTDGKKCSMSTIWQWVHTQKAELINSAVPIAGDKVRRTITTNFADPQQRYQIPMSGGPVDIISMTFIVDMWVTHQEVPVCRMLSYRQGDAELAQTVQYQFEAGHHRHTLEFHRQSDGQIVVTAGIVDATKRKSEPGSPAI